MSRGASCSTRRSRTRTRNETVDAFTAAYPNVDVEWIRDGTTQVMARLEAEFAAGNPQPDLLLIADTVTEWRGLEGAKRAGLMPYPEADVSAYEPRR